MYYTSQLQSASCYVPVERAVVRCLATAGVNQVLLHDATTTEAIILTKQRVQQAVRARCREDERTREREDERTRGREDERTRGREDERTRGREDERTRGADGSEHVAELLL
jgi:hypothetical protein